jgi:release factor glutamine methyltransferase
MKLDSLVKLYFKKLSKAGISDAFKEIRLIIKENAGIPIEKQILNEHLMLNEKQYNMILESLDRRLKREPLDRILSKKTFRDIELILSPNVFSPRKETELLIDIIINLNIKPRKVLELGTGTGAITIALMKRYPNANCVSTDINEKCLQLAKKNAIKNNVFDQINFICCNWLDIFVDFDFDLIVANPPYIKSEVIKSLDPEVKHHDPIISLDGGKHGLDCYEAIILALGNKLRNNTKILFEIGYDQALEVTNIMKEAKIMYTKVFNDYSNNPRFVLGAKENFLSKIQ